jgi:hypothetical protein
MDAYDLAKKYQPTSWVDKFDEFKYWQQDAMKSSVTKDINKMADLSKQPPAGNKLTI